MALSNPTKAFIAFFVILGAGILGYVIGSQGAKWAQERKITQYRTASTAAAVARMNDTLRDGNQLPDNEFHNLRGGTSKLSDLVQGGAIVAYLRSDCGKCKLEMKELSEGVRGDEQSSVIIISDSDPGSVLQLADELGLTWPLLLDYESQYRKRLGIFVFPFNIIVDDSLLIRKMIADYIRSDELEDIVQSKRGNWQ